MEVLDEESLAHCLEWLSGRELGRGAATSKWLRDGMVKAAGNVLEDDTATIRCLHCLETQAYAFDSFSEDGFTGAPRRGPWFLSWRGSLQWEDHLGNYVGFGPRFGARIEPAHRCGVRTIETCVVLGESQIRALFSSPTVQPLVICSESATHQERTAMRSALFFGPAQRWLSLFKLGEWIEKLRELATRIPAANVNPRIAEIHGAVFAGLATPGGGGGSKIPDGRSLSGPPSHTINPVEKRLTKDGLLILTHHQFNKLKKILGPDRFARFGIPDDMSIYFGGDGTTAAVILVPFHASEFVDVGPIFGYEFNGVDRLLLLTRGPRH